MKLKEIVNVAKTAQNKLKKFSCPAEHIYISDLNSTSPILIFISESYNAMDLYNRTNLATKIHTGPLAIRYYILGTTHIKNTNTVITRSKLYQSTKIYGKTPLLFDNSEYASISDTGFIMGKNVDANNRI